MLVASFFARLIQSKWPIVGCADSLIVNVHEGKICRCDE